MNLDHPTINHNEAYPQPQTLNFFLHSPALHLQDQTQATTQLITTVMIMAVDTSLSSGR